MLPASVTGSCGRSSLRRPRSSRRFVPYNSHSPPGTRSLTLRFALPRLSSPRASPPRSKWGRLLLGFCEEWEGRGEVTVSSAGAVEAGGIPLHPIRRGITMA